MIANFRADTDSDTLKYECASIGVSIGTFNNRVGSFWVRYAEEPGGWVRCGQVFVPGMRPTRSDVVGAFHGGY